MIIGIDPGATGAIAALWDTGEGYGVVDMPDSPEGIARTIARIAAAAQERHEACEAAIERLHAMPSFGRAPGPQRNPANGGEMVDPGLSPKGAIANFKQGYTYGQALGILAALAIPYEEVAPAVWKRFHGLNPGIRDKSQNLTLARVLFPKASLARKRDDGRADALLIAEWKRRQTRPAPEDLLGRRQRAGGRR